MNVEDVDKAIDLLYEYHYIDGLLKKKTYETHSTIAMLFHKIDNTDNEVEQFQYRKEITDSIQKLISNSKRDGCNFEKDVLLYGLKTATIKLELKHKELKNKIEKL